MTFTQWYKETMDDDWHEDHGGLYLFCYEMCCQYEAYCKDYALVPVWNG